MISQFECHDEDAGPASAPTILLEIDPQSNGPTALPAPPLVPYLFAAEQRLPRPSPVPADFAERGQIDHTVFYNAPPPSMRTPDQFRPTVPTTYSSKAANDATISKADLPAVNVTTAIHHHSVLAPGARLMLVQPHRASKRPTVRVAGLMNASAVRRAFRPSSPPTLPPARAA